MMQHGREPWEIYGNIKYGASEHEMEWGSFSQPPLCTVFGCVFLYTQLSNGIIDSRPINHDISMIPDDRTWLLKCWSSCFWVGCGHGRQAWERSQRSIAGESWVAQLRFSGLCGHGPMAIPLDFDGDITDGSLIFRNLKTWNIWKPNIWQMSSNPNSMRKNMFHRPNGFFHLLPTDSKGVSHHEGSNFAIRNEQSLGW